MGKIYRSITANIGPSVPNVALSRWSKPRIYYTIIALYLIVIGTSSIVYPAYLRYFTGLSYGGSNDWSLFYYAPASVFLIISVLGGLLLLKKRPSIYLSAIPLFVASLALAIYFAGEWGNLPHFVEKSALVPGDLQEFYTIMAMTATLLFVTIGMDVLWFLGWKQRKAIP